MLDGFNGGFLSDFIEEWCHVFIYETFYLFADGSGWSRSTCKALTMTEDVASMEEVVKDDSEMVGESWHICRKETMGRTLTKKLAVGCLRCDKILHSKSEG